MYFRNTSIHTPMYTSNFRDINKLEQPHFATFRELMGLVIDHRQLLKDRQPRQ